MHAAHQFNSAMFSVTLHNREIPAAELLEWHSHDRLGIVVNSPLGALGATLLTLSTVTAFYDADRTRRRRPIYPPIYLFHVGRGWGFYGELDFWPSRKEIVVTPDATEVLRAINNVGITHLVVPEGEPMKVTHRYKEPEEARDRLRKCYVYSPDGAARDADVRITTRARPVVENMQRVAFPVETLSALDQMLATTPRLQGNLPLAIDMRDYAELMRRRCAEVDPTDAATVRIRERISKALTEELLEESVRTTDFKDALERLA